MGDDSCAWFAKIPSTAQEFSSVMKGKKVLQVIGLHCTTTDIWIFFYGDGGVRARMKVPKWAKKLFNNQHWLEAAM
jgi:hypothetical protein